ncbi:MAG: hypothetical protein JWO52_5446 [Gammaproteobacteria bacterium]|jgi:uncharacterized protein (DUF924 family)|nr:hypothetical protein [Gammaproteobacteria bacterium]
MDDALRIREFWFGKPLTGSAPGQGEMASRALALTRRASLWFEPSPQLMGQQDELIRSEFKGLVERAGRGELDGWADSPRRRLSLIILLDQFPRHIYRGTPQAFAYDPKALALTLSGMQSAADGALNIIERLFFYMPLQHAESTEVQDASVSAYRQLVTESPAELRSTFESALASAEEHRALIRQFGRFPHRNHLLGRDNTAEEDEYLKQSTDSFGQ